MVLPEMAFTVPSWLAAGAVAGACAATLNPGMPAAQKTAPRLNVIHKISDLLRVAISILVSACRQKSFANPAIEPPDPRHSTRVPASKVCCYLRIRLGNAKVSDYRNIPVQTTGPTKRIFSDTSVRRGPELGPRRPPRVSPTLRHRSKTQRLGA